MEVRNRLWLYSCSLTYHYKHTGSQDSNHQSNLESISVNNLCYHSLLDNSYHSLLDNKLPCIMLAYIHSNNFSQLVLWYNEAYFSNRLRLIGYNIQLSFHTDIVGSSNDEELNQADNLLNRTKLSTYGRMAFSYAGRSAWNSLPTYLKDSSLSLVMIKRY